MYSSLELFIFCEQFASIEKFINLKIKNNMKFNLEYIIFCLNTVIFVGFIKFFISKS